MRNLNLNVNDDHSDMNDYMICWDFFKKRPNRSIVYGNFNNGIVHILSQVSASLESRYRETILDNDKSITHDKFLYKYDDDVFISVLNLESQDLKSTVDSYTIYYKDPLAIAKINEIQEILNCSKIESEFEEPGPDVFKIKSLMISDNRYELQDLAIDELENIDLFYTNNVVTDYEVLVDSINDNVKGINIICGEKGVGKTKLLEYIITAADKKFIFIQNNLVDHSINNHEFIKFLEANRDCVFIIDNCEELINERLTISNILSIVDGFTSECYNAHFILVYDIEMGDINNELLNSNSLHTILEVGELSVKKIKKLAKHLDRDYKTISGSKLVDVFTNKKFNKNKSIGI